MNIKVFHLMPKINETKHVSWHKTCTCKCRLDASICNNKRSWNNNKCRCKCKELIGKCRCNDGFIWNASICECEFYKSCDIGEWSCYENCKCKKNWPIK